MINIFLYIHFEESVMNEKFEVYGTVQFKFKRFSILIIICPFDIHTEEKIISILSTIWTSLITNNTQYHWSLRYSYKELI